MKYNKSIIAQRGLYALLEGGIYALSWYITTISCERMAGAFIVYLKLKTQNFFRQFREPIIRVIEYTGWRKAMANQALGWNLAAETGATR